MKTGRGLQVGLVGEAGLGGGAGGDRGVGTQEGWPWEVPSAPRVLRPEERRGWGVEGLRLSSPTSAEVGIRPTWKSGRPFAKKRVVLVLGSIRLCCCEKKFPMHPLSHRLNPHPSPMTVHCRMTRSPVSLTWGAKL